MSLTLLPAVDVRVELSGGIRDDESLRAALDVRGRTLSARCRTRDGGDLSRCWSGWTRPARPGAW